MARRIVAAHAARANSPKRLNPQLDFPPLLDDRDIRQAAAHGEPLLCRLVTQSVLSVSGSGLLPTDVRGLRALEQNLADVETYRTYLRTMLAQADAAAERLRAVRAVKSAEISTATA